KHFPCPCLGFRSSSDFATRLKMPVSAPTSSFPAEVGSGRHGFAPLGLVLLPRTQLTSRRVAKATPFLSAPTRRSRRGFPSRFISTNGTEKRLLQRRPRAG